MRTVFHKTETEAGSSYITIGHAQMGHVVQRGAPHQQLNGLSVKLSGAQLISEYRLEPEHPCFRQTPPMILDLFLPLGPPDLSDALKILVSIQPLLVAVAVLPDLGVPAGGMAALAFRFLMAW
jgi:hypothetical protein